MLVLRRPQVEAKTGLSRSSIYAAIAAGSFPKPIRISISGKSVAWIADEVDRWLEDRISERDKREGSI